MGCWDETCCLSNQIVRENDPAVMVVIKPGEVQHGLVCNTFGSQFWDFKQVKEIHKGTYNDYGWLKETHKEDDDPRLDYYLCFFHKNIWDEVVDFERKENENATFRKWTDLNKKWCPEDFGFAHMDKALLKIAEECEEKEPEKAQEIKDEIKDEIETRRKENEPPEFAEEFIFVADFADKVRRDILSGPRWRGHQDHDGEERRNLIHRLEAENQAKRQAYVDNDYEHP